jgi:hypothetical protein
MKLGVHFLLSYSWLLSYIHVVLGPIFRSL